MTTTVSLVNIHPNTYSYSSSCFSCDEDFLRKRGFEGRIGVFQTVKTRVGSWVARVGICVSCHWYSAVGFARPGASLSLCVLHDVDSAPGPQGGMCAWCRQSILSFGTQAGPVRDKEMPFWNYHLGCWTVKHLSSWLPTGESTEVGTVAVGR